MDDETLRFFKVLGKMQPRVTVAIYGYLLQLRSDFYRYTLVPAIPCAESKSRKAVAALIDVKSTSPAFRAFDWKRIKRPKRMSAIRFASEVSLLVAGGRLRAGSTG